MQECWCTSQEVLIGWTVSKIKLMVFPQSYSQTSNFHNIQKFKFEKKNQRKLHSKRHCASVKKFQQFYVKRIQNSFQELGTHFPIYFAIFFLVSTHLYRKKFFFKKSEIFGFIIWCNKSNVIFVTEQIRHHQRRGFKLANIQQYFARNFRAYQYYYYCAITFWGNWCWILVIV